MHIKQTILTEPAEWRPYIQYPPLYQRNNSRLSCVEQEEDGRARTAGHTRYAYGDGLLSARDGQHIYGIKATRNKRWASVSRKANILLIIYVRAGGTHPAIISRRVRSASRYPERVCVCVCVCVCIVFAGVRCHREAAPPGEINTVLGSGICPFCKPPTRNRNRLLPPQ